MDKSQPPHSLLDTSYHPPWQHEIDQYLSDLQKPRNTDINTILKMITDLTDTVALLMERLDAHIVISHTKEEDE